MFKSPQESQTRGIYLSQKKRNNTAASPTDNVEDKATLPRKQTHTNWSKDGDAKRMVTTVKDWLEKSDNVVDENRAIL